MNQMDTNQTALFRFLIIASTVLAMVGPPH